MANPNKARGTSFESAVCRYLNRELGLTNEYNEFHSLIDPMNIRRQAQSGAKDIGDAWAWPVVLEMKDVKATAVPAWIRQAEIEAVNARFPYGVAIHKRRQAHIGLSTVHMSIGTYSRIRRFLGHDQRTMRETYGIIPTVRSRHTDRWYVTLALHDFVRLLQHTRARES